MGPEDTGEPQRARGRGQGCMGTADGDGGDQALREEEIWHMLLF